MAWKFNPFTGTFDQVNKVTFNAFSPWTHFACGSIADITPASQMTIDCGTIADIDNEAQRVFVGDLGDY